MQTKQYKDDVYLVVGTKVVKYSGKPFKSGLKVGTISGLTKNLHTGKVAYTFEEDGSVVDAYQCRCFGGASAERKP
jgi:hypothetical protein